jgi:hypothetical protein
MVQSFLNQQPINPIGVEDEICSAGVLVSDHTSEVLVCMFMWSQGAESRLT